MSKFPILKVRKNPVVEDAILFDGTVECATRIINWVLESPSGSAHWRCPMDLADSFHECSEPHHLRIRTPYGWTTVPAGYTVVQEESGRFIAVDPLGFESDYDVMEGAE